MWQNEVLIHWIFIFKNSVQHTNQPLPPLTKLPRDLGEWIRATGLWKWAKVGASNQQRVSSLSIYLCLFCSSPLRTDTVIAPDETLIAKHTLFLAVGTRGRSLGKPETDEGTMKGEKPEKPIPDSVYNQAWFWLTSELCTYKVNWKQSEAKI